MSAQAQVDSLPVVSLYHPVWGVDLKPHTEALVDTADRMSLAEARAATTYQPLSEIQMPLPLGQRLWGRMWLRNEGDSSMSLFLFTRTTDSTVVYLRDSTGLRQVQNGNYVPASKRSVKIGRPVGVQIELVPHALTEVYVLMTERAGVGPHFWPRLYNYYRWSDYYFSRNYFSNLLLGLFMGAMAIMLLYNFVLYISTRQLVYLFYACYLLSVGTALHFEMVIQQFSWLGFGYFHLNRAFTVIGLNGAALFYLLFGRQFIGTKTLTPTWDRVLKIMVQVRLVTLTIGLVMVLLHLKSDLAFDISINLYGIEGLILLVYFAFLIRTRSTIAWFFIVGSILVFGGGFTPVLLSSQFGLDVNVANYLLASLTVEILVFSLGLGYKMRRQQQDKLQAEQSLNQELQKVNSAFGRFVPHAFIESLGHASVMDIQLGDQVQKKEVTVMFSDIRGYTALAEDMTPQENFNFLNAYLGRMGPIIQAHGGFVNQYYGDGIMALFLDSPINALQAAIEMLHEIEVYNDERSLKARQPIQVGIGLHTGPLMMGIIGDTLRLEAGVVSDTVNTASRMEGLTKHFGVNLLLSDATYQQLLKEELEVASDAESAEAANEPASETATRFGMRLLGNVLVKGRRQPLLVYECYDGDPARQRDRKQAITPEFEAGLSAYLKGDFARALRAWESVWHGLPGDGPTKHYVPLAQYYLTEGPPDTWDGVEVMVMK